MRFIICTLFILTFLNVSLAQNTDNSEKSDSLSQELVSLRPGNCSGPIRIITPAEYVMIVTHTVSSDRPTVGTGTYVMPHKKIQIEAGGWYGSDKDADYRTDQLGYNSTQIRFGISQNAELRVSSTFSKNTYTHEPTGLSSDDSGLSPLVVGTKIRLNKRTPRKWNNFTLMANVHLNKVATPIYQTPTLGHDLTLANTIQFSDKASLGSNVGLTWDGFGSTVTGIYTSAFSRQLTQKATIIGELYGYWPQGAGIDVSFDGGFTFLFNNQLQGDIIGGFGISERAQDWFVGIGLCFLLNPID